MLYEICGNEKGWRSEPLLSPFKAGLPKTALGFLSQTNQSLSEISSISIPLFWGGRVLNQPEN